MFRYIRNISHLALVMALAAWLALAALAAPTYGQAPAAPLPAAAGAGGTLVAWGNTVVPPRLSGVTAIAAGYYHNLALLSDGTVVAWGCSGTDFGQCTIPAGLSGVTAISAGYSHSLALKSDGTMVAWGCNTPYDNYGQCWVPSSGVTAISAGALHNLALKSDGTVVVWGDNRYHQKNIPAGLNGVTAIAAGYFHSLALKSDGTVVAWGDNQQGQSTVPAGLSGVTAIGAGGFVSLAVRGDGTVVAWGANASGQSTVPAGLSGVVAVTAGASHSLALKSDGTVVAWGDNQQGQSTVPAGLGRVMAIAAGTNRSVALVLPAATPTATPTASPTASATPTSTPSPRNREPAVQAGGPYAVEEGGAVAVSAVGSDPDGDALTYAWDLDGDGTFETPGQSVSFSAATLDGPGNRAIAVQVTDPGGLRATAQATVDVTNVAPTATLNVPSPVSEGSRVILSLTDPVDPSGADTAAGFQYAFDCGDGRGYSSFGSDSSLTCPMTDNGTYTIKGRIEDKDHGFNEYAAQVQVVNLPPTTQIALDPPKPNGDHDWYISAVQLTVNAADNQGGSGVAEKRCVLDPAGPPASFDAIPVGCAYAGTGASVASNGQHTLYAASVDKAGNKEAPKIVSFWIDTVAPTATPSQSPPANSAGWNNSDVTITWNWADTGGSGLDPANCTESGASSREGKLALAATCKDLAGNLGSATYTLQVDKTEPDVQCGNADGNWHAGEVSIACAASDGGSGLTSPIDASFTLKTNVDSGTEAANASTDSRSICDLAGNKAIAGPIAGNKVDKKAPSITITAPTAAAYQLNQAVAADFVCTDGGSGVASCTGTVANGSNIDNATAGPKTFTVNVTDNVGNASSQSVQYTVDYNPSGFTGPVNSPPTVNTGKSGRTYAVRWQLTDAAGTFVNALSAVSNVTYKATACIDFTNDPVDALEATATGGTSLRYDSSANQYIYNWATPSAGCYTLFLTLDSGQVLQAYFNMAR